MFTSIELKIAFKIKDRDKLELKQLKQWNYLLTQKN